MGKKKKQLSDEALVIAYRIREARARKFKTIKDAAEALPVEKTLWSHWENARVKPQKMTTEKIAALLGVSIDSFYQEPDDWEAEKSRFLTELTSRTRKGLLQGAQYIPAERRRRHANAAQGGSQADDCRRSRRFPRNHQTHYRRAKESHRRRNRAGNIRYAHEDDRRHDQGQPVRKKMKTDNKRRETP